MRKVFFGENGGDAYRVRDLLREHGIAADVANELLASARGELPMDLSTMICVWIGDESRAAEAEEIIRSIQNPPSDRPAWSCPNCDEELAGSFTACWSCQAERPA